MKSIKGIFLSFTKSGDKKVKPPSDPTDSPKTKKDETTVNIPWTAGQLGDYWVGYWKNRRDWEELIATVGRPSLQAFGDGASTTLKCTHLDVNVEITGVFSKTTFEMTFYNETQQILSGELTFPLPEGAVVSGFGLDVDGKIVDGVVVEKKKARIAFETEMRKNIDPGLIEKVQGNNFKTRVYPILPKGSRKVRIVYSQDLHSYSSQNSERDGIYSLNLQIPDSLQSFKMQISIAKQNDKLPFSDAETGLIFKKKGNKYVAQLERTKNLEAFKRGIAIVIPSGFSSCTLVEEGEDDPNEKYFCICDFVEEDKKEKSPLKVSKIGILWDASYSREKIDKTMDFTILKKILKKIAEVNNEFEVEVTLFRNKLETPKLFKAEKGSFDSIINYLQNEVIYDGGTFLGSLPTKDKNPNIDFYLLFSDGLGNLCKDIPKEQYAAPIYGFGKDLSTNHSLLSYICERSGGLYSNLNTVNIEEAISRIGNDVFGLISCEYDFEKIDDVYPAKFTTLSNGRILISGRLLADEAEIIANFGYGSQISISRKYKISSSNAMKTNLIQFYWAQQKISELEIFAQQNKDEILALGKKFSIVTSNTSLMVLETLEQHLEHKICPAKTRHKMYEEYMRIIAQREKESRDSENQKLSTVKNWWRNRVDWWNEDHQNQKRSLPIRTYDSSTAIECFDEEEAEEEYSAVHKIKEVSMELSMKSMPKKKKAMKTSNLIQKKLMSSPKKKESIKAPQAPKTPSSEKKDVGGSIVVKPWDPKTPYLVKIKSLESTNERYLEYINQRKNYGTSPAFYLDVAEFFFKQNERELAVRIITTVVELELNNDQLFRTLAYTLDANNELELAVYCYEKILELRPEHPQPYRDLALIYEQQGLYEKAAQLLYKVLIGKWEDRFSQIEDVALMELNHLIAKAEREGKKIDIPIMNDKEFIQLLDVDIRTVFVWDTDQTCIDLWVIEPTNETVYYGQKRSTIGGYLSRDIMEGWGPNEYFIRKAIPGTYKISANYYSNYQQSLTGATTIFAKVWRNYGRENESCETVISRITKQGETVQLGNIIQE